MTHVEFLGSGGDFVERSASCLIGPVLVTEDVVEAHAAVRPGLAERYGAYQSPLWNERRDELQYEPDHDC